MTGDRKSGALVWKIVLAVCLLIVAGCVIFIIAVKKNEKEAREVYERAAGESRTETRAGNLTETEENMAETDGTAHSEASLTEETEESGGEGTENECPVDFQELQAVNPDIYAWITVPGTKVDYPIAQRAGDRNFYLHHNINGDYEFAGMIYTEDYNRTDFTDPNTVIYGHNMHNDTMFTTLHYFEDRDFFDRHQEVLIYTPEQTLHYTIFAAYAYDNRHLMESFDFSDPDIFDAYLDQVFAIRDMKAYFRDGVTVTSEDKIITLSTCFDGRDEERYLIQAVLADE